MTLTKYREKFFICLYMPGKSPRKVHFRFEGWQPVFQNFLITQPEIITDFLFDIQIQNPLCWGLMIVKTSTQTILSPFDYLMIGQKVLPPQIISLFRTNSFFFVWLVDFEKTLNLFC